MEGKLIASDKVMQEKFRLGFLKNFDLIPSRSRDSIDNEEELIKKGIRFKEYGFTLRPINDEDIKKITNFFPYGEVKRIIGNFVLEDNFTKDKSDLYHFVYALKLIKEGDVSFSNIITNNTYTLGYVPDIFINRYTLYYNEIEDVSSIIKNIIRCFKNLKYRTAIHYFDKTYYELLPFSDHDVLIYLMICAESLFLDGKNHRYTGSIIGMACSMLIGKDEKEREIIREIFDTAYKVRNIIVHSKDFGSVRDEKMKNYYRNIRNKNIEIRGYLRESIKKIIS